MKCNTAVIGSLVSIWLSASACCAQQATLTIPLTVPPPVPAPLTLPVSVPLPANTKVTANGITYLATGTLTGTLTLTPVTQGADLPVGPPADWPAGVVWPPSIDWPPAIQEYKSLAGLQTFTYALDDLLTIGGQNFGELPGSLAIGLTSPPVTAWSDSEIRVKLAAGVVAPAPDGALVAVTRADGASGSGWRVIINAPLVPTP